MYVNSFCQAAIYNVNCTALHGIKYGFNLILKNKTRVKAIEVQAMDCRESSHVYVPKTELVVYILKKLSKHYTQK